MQRAAILFSDFGPYHVARIEALGRSLREAGRELVAFRFTERSSTYGWKPVAPIGMETVTLAERYPSGAGAAARMAGRFQRQLRERRVGAVFLPTYSPLPNLLCFLAAKAAGCRTILMTESWFGTEDAGPVIKLAKHALVRMFDAALVGGTPQRDYVAAYGMPREKIFLGYDVVDTDFFAARADEVRGVAKKSVQCSVGSCQSEEEIRAEAGGAGSIPSGLRSPTSDLRDSITALGLPERFFLNLGRFVEKKNLATLVAAYARFVQKAAASPPHASGLTPQASIPALVLVGEGPLRADLERQARELALRVVDRGMSSSVTRHSPPVWSPRQPVSADSGSRHEENLGTVFFYGFHQSDMTPVFFALCEAFVLPSSREEWGLVVNEAMACGAPVVVSNRVGCAQDLVGGTSVAPVTVTPAGGSPPAECHDRRSETAATNSFSPQPSTINSLEERPGFTFDPEDVNQLAELLGRFAAEAELKERLGRAGQAIIREWGPEKFGQGGLMALNAAGAKTP